MNWLKRWLLLSLALLASAQAIAAPTTKLQVQSAETFGTGAYTTSAFTPSNNSLLIVVVRAQSESNDAMTGADITMTPSTGTATSRLTSATAPTGWSYGMRIWTIPITTGVSMTIQADGGAFNVHQYKVEVYEYTSYNTGTPVGATASGSDADGDGAASISLSGAPLSSSEVLGFAQVALSAAGTPGVGNGSGYTEILDHVTSAWSVDEDEWRGSSTSTTVDWTDLSTTGGIGAGALLLGIEIKLSTTPATLSAATPSGTLGTSTTATLGATTDQTSGTFYTVLETSSGLLTGITAAQIKAGQNNTSAAALKSGNAAVSTTTPSVGITGLTASTTYNYSSVQNNSNGDSNIVTGSFTTGSATSALLLRRRRQ